MKFKRPKPLVATKPRLVSPDGEVVSKEEQEAPSRPFRLGLAVPSRDSVKAAFAFDMCNMVAYAATTMVSRGLLEIVVLNNKGTLLASQRHELIVEAMKSQCDGILWLDDDMRFPPDMIQRLLSHGQDFVGANYLTRRQPYHPTAYKDVDPERPAHFSYCWTNEDSTGLEEVDTVGMGALFTHTRVFLAMRPPAFEIMWNHKDGGFIGEDVYFCLKAKQAGFKIYVDHDLSKVIGHIGEVELFNLIDGPVWKEEAEQGLANRKALWESTQRLRAAGLMPGEDVNVTLDESGTGSGADPVVGPV